jgi:hypothetical protein
MTSLFEAQPTKHIKNAKGGDERGYRGVSLNLTKPQGSTVDSTNDGDSATLPGATFTRFSRNQQERCPDVTLPAMNNSAACGLPRSSSIKWLLNHKPVLQFAFDGLRKAGLPGGMSETRKLVAILAADFAGADVDHFRFVPVVARPALIKAFRFWIAACSTTCSSKQSFAT